MTHALSFPRAERVVYSTCSVHAEENEVVVVKALERSRAEGWGFRLKDALPAWKSRGGREGDVAQDRREKGDRVVCGVDQDVEKPLREEFEDSFDLRKCLRASPEADLTNGFFVALFERDKNFEHDIDQGSEEEEDGENPTPVSVASNKRRMKKEKKKRKKMKLNNESSD